MRRMETGNALPWQLRCSLCIFFCCEKKDINKPRLQIHTRKVNFQILRGLVVVSVRSETKETALLLWHERTKQPVWIALKVPAHIRDVSSVHTRGDVWRLKSACRTANTECVMQWRIRKPTPLQNFHVCITVTSNYNLSPKFPLDSNKWQKLFPHKMFTLNCSRSFQLPRKWQASSHCP